MSPELDLAAARAQLPADMVDAWLACCGQPPASRTRIRPSGSSGTWAASRICPPT
ncbi:hypothetical protein ACFQX7_37035 [Luedemannella flava]